MPTPLFTKISALLIDDKGRLLTVRGRGDDFYKAFGGKVDSDESDIECLRREVKEEGNVELIDATFYFELPLVEIHGRPGQFFTNRFYIITIQGQLKTNPDDETEELLWVSKDDIEQNRYNIASALGKYAIPRLIEDKLLR